MFDTDSGGRYERLENLGEGAFGEVYRAYDSRTKRDVAVKRIKLGESVKEGINWTALREIRFLQELKHANIVELVDVFAEEGEVNLVFEVLPNDLEKVLHSKLPVTAAHVKMVLFMVLQGVGHLHENFVLHRDLKPSNLLVSPDGVVKIADFGLARTYGSPRPQFTSNVVTRWYRAPELIYGATQYGPGVDMWAVGCIFAELIARRPLFPGKTDIDQLDLIFRQLSTPTESNWPGLSTLPMFFEFNKYEGVPLNSKLPSASAQALDLLAKFLAFDPNKRISAEEALKHPYFTSEAPPMTPPGSLTEWGAAQRSISLAQRNGESVQSRRTAGVTLPKPIFTSP